MEVRLTEKEIKTIYNSLRASRADLRAQLRTLLVEHKLGTPRRTVIETQIIEVEDAMTVLEESCGYLLGEY